MPFLAPAIAAISAFVSPAVTFLTTNFVGRLLVSVAASALMQALAPKPKAGQSGGISTRVTQTGGLNPGSFILGKYATSGSHICPPMSFSPPGASPLSHLTYVINLGDLPGQTLDRVIINDRYVTLGSPTEAIYGFGLPVTTTGFAWVKYYSGAQTTADPYLLAQYGSYPNRPWTSDMIGRGMCYAIVTFTYNPEVWQGLPRVRFEVGGIPLYDIRKDSTAGGSGTHRWATPSTWEQTVNPMVMIYNILRGISIPSGGVWGGSVVAADLPAAAWMAAMNECDVASPAVGGGTEPQFRAGLEVTFDQQPADVIAELLKACSGQLVEVGGVWKPRAGGPGLPVYFFTDADVVVTQPQDFKPFPGLEAAFNGIHASYPEPDSLWESKDAPPRYNATYEAEDRGRRLVADLALPAVPYPAQVQRLMVAYIKEERRFRRHGLTLPPDAAILEPLDSAGWTSDRNGYVTKVFEVSQVIDDLRTCLQRVALRERDSTDYSYPSDILLPSAPGVPGPVVPGAQSVPSWNVIGVSITDAAGNQRRAGLQLSWDGTNQYDVKGIRYEVRVTATGAVVHTGSTYDVSRNNIIISAGLVHNTNYQARGRFIADRPTTWSAWVADNTPNVGITNDDFVGGIGGFLNNNSASWGQVVPTLPATGNWFGRQVVLLGDGKQYTWNGTAWITGVAATDIIGTLGIANFATSLRPPEIVSSLPTTGNYEGRLVFLTADDKLYRHLGTPTGSAGFTRAVDGTDLIANSVIAGKVAAGAIGTPELAAEALVASKALISDFSNVYLDYDMEDPDYYSTQDSAVYTFPEIVTPEVGAKTLSMGPNASQRSVISKWFGVEPNADYAVSLAAWLTTATAGSGRVTAYIQLGSLGASKAVTLTRTLLILDRTDTAAATRAVLNILTGSTERRARFLFRREAGGTATSRHGGPRIMRRMNGALVVDGFLAVMGMAAFGGDLQSNGFVPGTTGWRIRSTGAAEFSTATIRAGLQFGALTDQFQAISNVSPLTLPANGDTFLNGLAIGAMDRGNIYHRGIVFEATLGSGAMIVKLYRRLRQLGGAFGAFVEIGSWTITAGGTYAVYNDSGALSGYFDDLEYHIRAFTGSSAGGAAAVGAAVRQVYLTVIRQVK